MIEKRRDGCLERLQPTTVDVTCVDSIRGTRDEARAASGAAAVQLRYSGLLKLWRLSTMRFVAQLTASAIVIDAVRTQKP